jgi:hypothetical protein
VGKTGWAMQFKIPAWVISPRFARDAMLPAVLPGLLPVAGLVSDACVQTPKYGRQTREPNQTPAGLDGNLQRMCERLLLTCQAQNNARARRMVSAVSTLGKLQKWAGDCLHAATRQFETANSDQRQNVSATVILSTDLSYHLDQAPIGPWSA